MNIAILGTGVVGTTIGTKLVQHGHQVMMGSRTADNPKAANWVVANAGNASAGTFADAAAFGQVVFNCTSGMASLEALGMAGQDNLKEKILIDVSNPLDFSKGFPPTLLVCNDDSLGEQIQRAFPETQVVKTLNTMTCMVMVNPTLVPGDHNVFLSGNDQVAKDQVAAWLGEWFGWKAESFLDLGDISSARGAEMILPLWVRLFGTVGHAVMNFHLVVGEKPAG